MDWKLPEATACPSWVEANADGGGYYRALYGDGLLRPLLADGARQLSASERVAALGDVDALTTMGDVKAGEALALVPEFAGDPVRQVVGSVIGIASGVRTDLVPPNLMPNYRRFIDKTFGERARQLGWTAKPDESPETQLLRTRIVPLAAVWGEEPALATGARRLADRKAVDANIAGSALTVAARTGDQAFYKELLAALPKTEDRQQRERIFGWVRFAMWRSLARR